MERAGKLLATSARSERELRDRLAAASFDPEVIEATIARLAELRLVDDADFARRWVEERSARKGLGPVKLRAELASKGVDPVAVEEALAEVVLDEEAGATAVAASLVRKVARKPLQAQAASLWQMLRRKGYSSEACEVAVKAVLPPEGWD
jgi:regulatory protein